MDQCDIPHPAAVLVELLMTKAIITAEARRLRGSKCSCPDVHNEESTEMSVPNQVKKYSHVQGMISG